MLFEKRLRDGIHDGQITLAFRRWQRSQVIAGHRYRTGLDLVEAEAVDVINPRDINRMQARAAGYGTVKDLLADLRGDDRLPLYRIRFRRLDESDPRADLAATASLAADEVASVTARLARMDQASALGPWTAAVLAQVADRPGVSSAVIAEAMGWIRADSEIAHSPPQGAWPDDQPGRGVPAIPPRRGLPGRGPASGVSGRPPDPSTYGVRSQHAARERIIVIAAVQ